METSSNMSVNVTTRYIIDIQCDSEWKKGDLINAIYSLVQGGPKEWNKQGAMATNNASYKMHIANLEASLEAADDKIKCLQSDKNYLHERLTEIRSIKDELETTTVNNKQPTTNIVQDKPMPPAFKCANDIYIKCVETYTSGFVYAREVACLCAYMTYVVPEMAVLLLLDSETVCKIATPESDYTVRLSLAYEILNALNLREKRCL